jgi:hypothetical protein
VVGFGKKGVVAGKHPLGAKTSHQSNPVLKFDVTPRASLMMSGIAFFGVGAVVFFDKLLDPGGVIINRVIELGPAGANLLFATLMAACLAFVVPACMGLLNSLGERIFVTLDNQSIAGPSRYGGSTIVRLDFRSIRDVDLSSSSNSEFLVITGSDGTKIRVGKPNFRNASEWAQFLSALDTRIRGQ